MLLADPAVTCPIASKVWLIAFLQCIVLYFVAAEDNNFVWVRFFAALLASMLCRWDPVQVTLMSAATASHPIAGARLVTSLAVSVQ